jgi:hypothetical protein
VNINETAARWWSDRFGIADKRDALKAALMKHLPDGDWETYNDYDPSGLLLAAVREVTECRGCMFSGDGLFPCKTGLSRRNDVLRSKEGYAANWVIVPNNRI